MAVRHDLVQWLLTSTPKDIEIGLDNEIGLDGTVGKVLARKPGSRRFKSHSSKCVIPPGWDKLCEIYDHQFELKPHMFSDFRSGIIICKNAIAEVFQVKRRRLWRELASSARSIVLVQDRCRVTHEPLLCSGSWVIAVRMQIAPSVGDRSWHNTRGASWTKTTRSTALCWHVHTWWSYWWLTLKIQQFRLLFAPANHKITINYSVFWDEESVP